MRDVGKYVEGCNLCQRMKNRMEEVAGKAEAERGIREAMDPPNSGLHHEVTNSGRKRCDPSSL